MEVNEVIVYNTCAVPYITYFLLKSCDEGTKLGQIENYFLIEDKKLQLSV